ncbi:class I mannose-6-phosphate isomerase [Nakamurella flavida]|uniref:Class I mannose-6-phosphate isomerase n=1 Tax=Nakamurella flavida TaxID=363630 RepID=A0A939C1F4_9ACTN|nr:class I mannose-6-phosphate isomerase [Nakamurella flavida]MBM9475410.1 class I mannose-6-phosphate isomerase [Nakamurella flavida]MBM9475502.1 class I mannose-6-phosphate isomerase [Nakamurella flavida]MDP9776990.1 mannose-6-phosphate isomerase [Nakamurella flavida]
MDLLQLPANQPRDRFYRGGERIAEFRGDGPAAPNTPEDWVGSTTCVRGQDPVGRTRLADGTDLADAVAADPAGWLGDDHVAAFGADTMLLVKLLDAGQRLPIHAHPHRTFAHEHLGSAHGKAEAWFLLTPGVVHLGLREDIASDRLLAMIENQDTDELLELMHRIEVPAGHTVYVPPGVLHAIGEGILLVEVQEPEDLSILLEWRGFDLDGVTDGHLDLGFATALEAVETTARTAADVAALVRGPVEDGDCLPAESAPYFRLDRLAVDGGRSVPAGFGVLVVVDGPVTVGGTASGARIDAPAGATVLIPFAAGDLTLAGSGAVVLARPPLARRAS